MAYIENKEEDLINGQQGQAPQGSQPLVGGESQLVGNGSGVSQAGVGAGGTGGWTNIQAYLGANKGDQGSAQALNKTVGSQFDNERKTFETDSKSTLGNAQKQVDDSRVSNEQADQSIKSAAENYSWDGNQKSEYSDGVAKMQNALNSQYAGPTNYTYNLGTQTQNYGNQLKDNTGFDALMKNVYSGAAQKPLSSGQFALQKQLDVNNQGLVDTRKNLSGAYDQLGSDRDKTVADTTSALGGYEQAFRTNQSALRDYLGQQSNKYDTAATQAEIDARKAYDTAFNNDQLDIVLGNGSFSSSVPKTAAGLESLANSALYQYWLSNPGNLPGAQSIYAPVRPTLDSFYSTQDAKHANVGDPEERAYNSIQDFLNSNEERKKQGFAVRG